MGTGVNRIIDVCRENNIPNRNGQVSMGELLSHLNEQSAMIHGKVTNLVTKLVTK